VKHPRAPGAIDDDEMEPVLDEDGNGYTLGGKFAWQIICFEYELLCSAYLLKGGEH
jgi:hypothetical protein